MYVMGCDVSRGYVDITVLNRDREVLIPNFRVDDSTTGGNLLKEQLKWLAHDSPSDILAVMENTGGYEANLAHWFRQQGFQVRVINPKRIHGYRQMELHHAVTDPSSARDIAEYAIRYPEDPVSNPFPDPAKRSLKRLVRILDGLARDTTRVKNRLDNLLFTVFPELLALCREDKPEWMLRLVQQYPIPRKLARGRVSRISRIRGITPAKAQQLIELAKNSRGSDNYPEFALLIRHLTHQLLENNRQEKQLKAAVEERYQQVYPSCPLTTVKGIAPYGAGVLMAHIGDIHRFHSANALTAFFGLDPLVRESGDLGHCRKISKRGPGMVRRILYMECFSMLAIPGHPIKRFYDRLRDRGHSHWYAMTAAMRKLTVIIYAILKNGTSYDPNYEDHQKALAQSERDHDTRKSRKEDRSKEPLPLDVPVSYREARRRRRLIKSKQEKGEGPHVSCDTNTGSCPPKKMSEVTFP